MSIEAVRSVLKRFQIDDKILEFPVSSATVELAAQALHIEPARIAKTLSFKTTEDYLLIVCAGDVKIDNHKYKETFGCKAQMLTAEEVENHIGHRIGGVCPFAIDNPQVKIFLDKSLKRFETVFPACGSSNSAIELAPGDLFNYVQSAQWIDVCKAKD